MKNRIATDFALKRYQYDYNCIYMYNYTGIIQVQNQLLGDSMKLPVACMEPTDLSEGLP